jgi:hypothetical protein
MVPVTIKNIIYYILYWYVYWQIGRGLYQNTHFKTCDIVTYNWKARVVLGSIYRHNKGKLKEVTMMMQCKDGSAYCNYFDLEDETEGGCDAFWLRKVRWWEKKK